MPKAKAYVRDRWLLGPGTYLLALFNADGSKHVHHYHGGHYLGWAKIIGQRVDEHQHAQAHCKWTDWCARHGYTWQVVRVWPFTPRAFEAAFKRRRHFADYCPLCHPEGPAKRTKRWRRPPPFVAPEVLPVADFAAVSENGHVAQNQGSVCSAAARKGTSHGAE